MHLSSIYSYGLKFQIYIQNRKNATLYVFVFQDINDWESNRHKNFDVSTVGDKEQEKEIESFKKRVMKSGVRDTISTNYLNDIEGDGNMINSQVYGFSMRRKRTPTTSNIQPGTTVRSYTQYNELQSSRCQSNISLDSLLTQYKHNPKNRQPNILRKVNYVQIVRIKILISKFYHSYNCFI